MFYICAIKSASSKLLESDEKYVRWYSLKIVWHLILPLTLHANHIVQCKLKLKVNLSKSLILVFNAETRF